MESQRIHEARGVAVELASIGAPKQETKEIVEACLGLRVTRLQLSPKGLAMLQSLGKRFHFGVATGSYAIRSVPTHGLGQWADGIGEATDLDEPNATVNVYLAQTDEMADRGRRAEEEEGDDAFGELLGIPRCCRDFYERGVRAVASGEDSFHWLVAQSAGPSKRVAAGCNFFGRYFGGSLLSHFPCSLCCEKSAEIARRTRAALLSVDGALADALTSTHFWAFLVERRGAVIAYPDVAQKVEGVYTVANGMTPLSESGIPSPTSHAHVTANALSLRIVSGDGSQQVWEGDAARFIYAGKSL